MKQLLFLLLMAFSACNSHSSEEKAKEAVSAFFSAAIEAPRSYKAIETTFIAKPAQARNTQEGETWLIHHYELSDPAKGRQERRDTLVVEPDGKVLFY